MHKHTHAHIHTHLFVKNVHKRVETLKTLVHTLLEKNEETSESAAECCCAVVFSTKTFYTMLHSTFDGTNLLANGISKNV